LEGFFFVPVPVVVLVVLVLSLAGVEVELLVLLPPHPAIAAVAAKVASSVSMAASDVRFIGQSPVVAWGCACPLVGPPYQGFAAPADPD
jgi:hypothetical protein